MSKTDQIYAIGIMAAADSSIARDERLPVLARRCAANGAQICRRALTLLGAVA